MILKALLVKGMERTRQERFSINALPRQPQAHAQWLSPAPRP
jgi:hypothetical protein